MVGWLFGCVLGVGFGVFWGLFGETTTGACSNHCCASGTHFATSAHRVTCAMPVASAAFLAAPRLPRPLTSASCVLSSAANRETFDTHLLPGGQPMHFCQSLDFLRRWPRRPTASATLGRAFHVLYSVRHGTQTLAFSSSQALVRLGEWSQTTDPASVAARRFLLLHCPPTGWFSRALWSQRRPRLDRVLARGAGQVLPQCKCASACRRRTCESTTSSTTAWILSSTSACRR